MIECCLKRENRMNCLEIVEFTIFKGFSSNDSEEMESENISKNTNIRWIKKAEKKKS